MAGDPKEEARQTAIIVEDAFRNIAANVKDAFAQHLDGLSTMGDTLVKDITKNLNSVARSSSILISNNEKIRFGLIKRSDILRQIAMSEAKILGIKTQIEVLELNQLDLINKKKQGHDVTKKQLADVAKAVKTVNYQMLEAEGAHVNIEDRLKTQIGLLDIQTHKLGLTGAVIKGINRIPVLKEILDSEHLLAEAIEATNKEGANRATVFKAGMVAIGKVLLERITDPAAMVALTLKVSYDILTAMDTQATSLARSFAISKESALKMRNRFNDIAVSSGMTLINTQELSDTQGKINDILGTSVELGSRQLASLTKASAIIQLSEEAFKGLVELTQQTGGNAEDIQDSILGTSKALQIQKGLFLNEKQILEEVLSTSASLKVQFGNNTDELTAAVVEAKMLGFNLKDIEAIQANMLNFESSISAELEAELLTGRELNLEKARYFALTGDIRQLTQEINKNGVDAFEFERMNVLQRDAFAKSVGLSSDRLSEILLTEQQNLNIQKELSSNSQLQEYLSQNKLGLNKESLLQAIQEGAVSKEILNDLGERDRLSLSTLSTNARFVKLTSRLKDVFSSFIDGSGGGLLTGVENMIIALDKSEALKNLAKIGAVAGLSVFIIGASKALWNLSTKGTEMNPTVVKMSGMAGLKGGIGGVVSQFMKVAGIAALAIESIQMIADGINAFTGGGGMSEFLTGKNIGRMIGGAIGGALVGTLSLGIGLPAGIGLGMMVGGMVGDMVGPSAASSAIPPAINSSMGHDVELATGGIVSQPTRALVGEAGREAVVPLDDFYAKLDQLIEAVGINRNIYMDGRLIGDAISVRSYK